MLIVLTVVEPDDPPPPQPASTGFAVNSTAISGTTSARATHNGVVLNSFLFISLILILV